MYSYIYIYIYCALWKKKTFYILKVIITNILIIDGLITTVLNIEYFLHNYYFPSLHLFVLSMAYNPNPSISNFVK